MSDEVYGYLYSISVSTRTQPLHPQDDDIRTLSLTFSMDLTHRRYVHPPGFSDPIILPEHPSSSAHPKRTAKLKIYHYMFDLVTVHYRQRKLMATIGIPSHLHSFILSRVASKVRPLLQQTCGGGGGGGAAASFVSTVITVAPIQREESDYNDPWIRNVLMEMGIKVPIPASKSFIERGLMRVELAAAGESSCCVVCMEEMENGEEVIRLPCNHHYHHECIVGWLQSSHLCPLCRYQMPTDDDDDLCLPEI